MITIRNKEEMEKYYVEQVNTCVFKDDVEFLCDIYVRANIKAFNITANNINANNINAFNIKAHNINSDDIKACNITAHNINAFNIDAADITANNIIYYSVCFAHNNIECNSIKGRIANSKHFVIEGKLIVKGE